MPGDRRRSSRARKRNSPRSRPSASAGPEPAAVFEEIERVLDTPLAELTDDGEERAHAEELTRQADAAPAIVRFRELVAFVAIGRRATQAGKLTPSDAVALARQLGVREPQFGEVRSMEDLPEVAHVVRWALAAQLLTRRATSIVPGPWSADLERDPLAAWFRVATTLLEHGLLDAFRCGWRKHYVALLDADVPALLAAIIEAGGTVPLAGIEAGGWEHVAHAYGYDPDDQTEREHVGRLVNGIVAQLADLGAVKRDNGDVALTDLGGALATAAIALTSDDELD
jgi:hypothetical protein